MLKVSIKVSHNLRANSTPVFPPKPPNQIPYHRVLISSAVLWYGVNRKWNVGQFNKPKPKNYHLLQSTHTLKKSELFDSFLCTAFWRFALIFVNLKKIGKCWVNGNFFLMSWRVGEWLLTDGPWFWTSFSKSFANLWTIPLPQMNKWKSLLHFGLSYMFLWVVLTNDGSFDAEKYGFCKTW